MGRLMGWLVVLALVPFPGALCLGGAATAAEQKTAILADGNEMQYAVALPDGFDPEAAYPAILVLPGGNQTIGGATRQIERFWEAGAAERGYIAFGAGAPSGKPFFGEMGGDIYLPQFMDLMLEQYRIEDDKFHLVGFSNGGESAYRIAVRRPESFRSITVFSGSTQVVEDLARLSRIIHLPISMFAGQSDEGVAGEMLKTKEDIEAAGGKVRFETVPRSSHGMEEMRTPWGQAYLFDRLEQKN